MQGSWDIFLTHKKDFRGWVLHQLFVQPLTTTRPLPIIAPLHTITNKQRIIMICASTRTRNSTRPRHRNIVTLLKGTRWQPWVNPTLASERRAP